MISRTEIRKRININADVKWTSDYNGFDMSKTHSQEERNRNIEKHNEEIIDLFSDSFNSNLIKDCFDCWKGLCYLTLDKKNFYNPPSLIKDFPGWTSEDIIYWLIKHGDEISDKFYDTIGKEFLKEENEEEEIYRYISRESRYKVLKRQKWRCNICNEKLKFNKDSNWIGEVGHIDHIHSFSKKESYKNGEENINELSNLQALCPNCNSKKGDKLIN